MIHVVNHFVYCWTPSLTKCFIDLLTAMKQRFLTSWMIGDLLQKQTTSNETGFMHQRAKLLNAGS